MGRIGNSNLETRNSSSELQVLNFDFIRRLPKTELHLHLEGTLQPEILRELARTKGRLQDQTEAWIQDQSKRQFRYGSLPVFLQAFKLVTLLLEGPADYALAARHMIERLATQRVRYAEVTLSAGVILWKKQSVQAIFEAILDAARQAAHSHSICIRWLSLIHISEPTRP